MAPSHLGTWIPLERGLLLAKQYNCDHALRPLIEFQPAAKSPPLAPKHLVAAGSGRPARRTGADAPSVGTYTRGGRKPVPEIEEDSVIDHASIRGSEDGSMTPSPSEVSSSSRTPSPILSSPEPPLFGFNGIDGGHNSPSPPGRKRKRRGQDLDDGSDAEPSTRVNGMGAAKSYGDQILEYFISDSNQLPDILINPPADMDPNMAIDDDGHTALHWACAMGRIRIVKFLLSAGADIFRVNTLGYVFKQLW